MHTCRVTTIKSARQTDNMQYLSDDLKVVVRLLLVDQSIAIRNGGEI